MNKKYEKNNYCLFIKLWEEKAHSKTKHKMSLIFFYIDTKIILYRHKLFKIFDYPN